MMLFARLARLTIAQKLPLYIVGAGVLVGLAIGITTYYNASVSLEQARRDQLVTALAGQKATLRTYLTGIRHDLVTLASSSTTRNALIWFSEAWEELGEQPTSDLQRLYITDNPHPVGQKDNLDAAEDQSTYSDTHALYHPFSANYCVRKVTTTSFCSIPMAIFFIRFSRSGTSRPTSYPANGATPIWAGHFVPLGIIQCRIIRLSSIFGPMARAKVLRQASFHRRCWTRMAYC